MEPARLIKSIIFISLIAALIIFPIDAPIALLAGLIMAFTLGNPFSKITGRMTHMLLQVSVVLLGFHINLTSALQAGKVGLMFTIFSIGITLLAGYLIGRWLHIDKKISFLISNGTAICGGSAIAAVAPVLKANEQQISVSLGTIFILNSVALFIFPALGHMLHLSQHQFGTWCAIAIHDTSSVVGAASKYGGEALQVATTIKLERALWIIPISLITAWSQRSSKQKVKIPYFIFMFVAAIIISSYLPQGAVVYNAAYLIAKKGFVITLFLIGAGLSLDKIKNVGWRPIVQGVILWLMIGSISLFAIKELL